MEDEDLTCVLEAIGWADAEGEIDRDAVKEDLSGSGLADNLDEVEERCDGQSSMIDLNNIMAFLVTGDAGSLMGSDRLLTAHEKILS